MKAILDEESARLGGGPAGWFFPSPAEYLPLLAAAGFAVPDDGWVRLLRQVRRFGTAAEMLGWLRSQTFPAYEPVLPAGGCGGVPPAGPRSERWPSCDAPTAPTISTSSGWTCSYGPPEGEIACTVMVSRRA